MIQRSDLYLWRRTKTINEPKTTISFQGNAGFEKRHTMQRRKQPGRGWRLTTATESCRSADAIVISLRPSGDLWWSEKRSLSGANDGSDGRADKAQGGRWSKGLKNWRKAVDLNPDRRKKMALVGKKKWGPSHATRRSLLSPSIGSSFFYDSII